MQSAAVSALTPLGSRAHRFGNRPVIHLIGPGAHFTRAGAAVLCAATCAAVNGVADMLREAPPKSVSLGWLDDYCFNDLTSHD